MTRKGHRCHAIGENFVRIGTKVAHTRVLTDEHPDRSGNEEGGDQTKQDTLASFIFTLAKNDESVVVTFDPEEERDGEALPSLEGTYTVENAAESPSISLRGNSFIGCF